jgi:hypothetical protein
MIIFWGKFQDLGSHSPACQFRAGEFCRFRMILLPCCGEVGGSFLIVGVNQKHICALTRRDAGEIGRRGATA